MIHELYADNYQERRLEVLLRAEGRCEHRVSGQRCLNRLGTFKISHSYQPYFEQLSMHHPDDDPGNPDARMIAVCASCHMRLHRQAKPNGKASPRKQGYQIQADVPVIILLQQARCTIAHDLADRQPHENLHAFALFRRAIVESNQDAWVALYDLYHFPVRNWIAKRLAGDIAAGVCEALVNDAFVTVFCAIDATRFNRFPAVPGLLVYLKQKNRHPGGARARTSRTRPVWSIQQEPARRRAGTLKRACEYVVAPALCVGDPHSFYLVRKASGSG